MEIQTTTNISTATNPMYAVPHHHGRETSVYISLAAVAIFVDDIILLREQTIITTTNTFIVTPTIRNNDCKTT